jgi:hypothetical protein
LSNAERNSSTLFNKSRKRFTVPKALKAILTWFAEKHRLKLCQMVAVKTAWATRALRVNQSGKTFISKTVDPVCNGSWSIAKQLRRSAGAYPLGHKKKRVETMVVSDLIVSTYLIL